MELAVVKPKELTQKDIQDMITLIAEFGEVVFSYLEKNFPKARSIGYIKIDGRIVSVAALKTVEKEYIDDVYGRAGLPAPRKHLYEYGYAATNRDFQGRGFSSAILKQLLNSLPEGQRIYATVRSENKKEIHILKKHGFKEIGELNSKRGDYKLKLFEYEREDICFSFRFRSRLN